MSAMKDGKAGGSRFLVGKCRLINAVQAVFLLIDSEPISSRNSWATPCFDALSQQKFKAPTGILYMSGQHVGNPML